MASKLTLKIVDAPALPGGQALMLCDSEGIPLPNQHPVSLHQSGPGDMAMLNIEFFVDGKQIGFDRARPETEGSPKA